MVAVDDIWRKIGSDDLVLVLRVDDYYTSYQQNGSIRDLLTHDFVEQFEFVCKNGDGD